MAGPNDTVVSDSRFFAWLIIRGPLSDAGGGGVKYARDEVSRAKRQILDFVFVRAAPVACAITQREFPPLSPTPEKMDIVIFVRIAEDVLYIGLSGSRARRKPRSSWNFLNGETALRVWKETDSLGLPGGRN